MQLLLLLFVTLVGGYWIGSKYSENIQQTGDNLRDSASTRWQKRFGKQKEEPAAEAEE